MFTSSLTISVPLFPSFVSNCLEVKASHASILAKTYDVWGIIKNSRQPHFFRFFGPFFPTFFFGACFLASG